MGHFTGCMVVNERNLIHDNVKYNSFFVVLFTEDYHCQPFKLIKFERDANAGKAWGITRTFPNEHEIQRKKTSTMDLIDEDNGFKDPYLINAYITWKEERDIIIVTNLHTIIFNEELQ